MPRRPSCALIVAPLLLLIVSGTAAFAATDGVSTFALPMSDVLMPVAASDGLAAGANGSEFATPPPDERGSSTSESRTGFESRYERRVLESRYRPRRDRYRDDYGWRWRGVTQLHAGFLDPRGDAEAGFVAGFRGGQQVDDNFQLGVGLDWRTKSGRDTQVLQSSTGPGGETIVTRREVSKFSSNLLPVMVYAQVSAPSQMSVVPYLGAAGTWEVLFLEADDFASGQRFDATYTGFGWQLWGGVAFPLSGRSKFVGEVFLNQGTVGRDAFDPALGQDVRETVDTDGVGARFGMSWGF